MTIFGGNGIIWDAEKNTILCRFDNGRYETKDKRAIEILTGFEGVTLIGEDAVHEVVTEKPKKEKAEKKEPKEETSLNEKEIESIEEEV